jgi:ActR/RegA family two-component response regulator
MSQTTQNFFTPDTNEIGSTVLIFSSDGSFIDHHRAILLSIGFVPITVHTLEAALAILRVMAPELAIVDEGVGAVDIQRILKRAAENGQNVPVLIVGSGADAELGIQAIEVGSASYLNRPAFQDDVVRALLAHCDHCGHPLWGPEQN